MRKFLCGVLNESYSFDTFTECSYDGFNDIYYCNLYPEQRYIYKIFDSNNQGDLIKQVTTGCIEYKIEFNRTIVNYNTYIEYMATSSNITSHCLLIPNEFVNECIL